MFEYMGTQIMGPPGGAATSMSSGDPEIDCAGFRGLLVVSNSRWSLLSSPEQSELLKCYCIGTEYRIFTFSCRVSRKSLR